MARLNDQKFKERRSQWRVNPNLWVRDHFPDESLTGQQINLFNEIGLLVQAKIKRATQEPMTEQEQEYASKLGISIMSGRGTGKDFSVAMAIMWFLANFANCKIPCTAPSAHQLKDVLWAEISKIIRLSKKLPTGESILSTMFEWQSDKVYMKDKKGKEWFAIARTVNKNASEDEQAVTLSGLHEDFMMIVADEAAGVPDPVFTNLEATMTGGLNFALMIFNPIKYTGFAIDSQYKNKKQWITLRWDSRESERVTKEFIQSYIDKHGEDSNAFRINIAGLPPISEDDALIPLEWIQNAMDANLQGLPDDPIVKGVDFGAGGDKSIICTRKGNIVHRFDSNNSEDSIAVVGWCISSYDRDETSVMYYDTIGIGHGIGGILRERRNNVISVDSRKTEPNTQFSNKRAEMYWRLREQFERGAISLPDDRDILDELMSIKYKHDSMGRIQIVKKEVIKKTLGHSPDSADALAISYAYPDSRFARKGASSDVYKKAKKAGTGEVQRGVGY